MIFSPIVSTYILLYSHRMMGSPLVSPRFRGADQVCSGSRAAAENWATGFPPGGMSCCQCLMIVDDIPIFKFCSKE